MIFSGFSPVWFLGYDALTEIIFIFVTMMIAWYSVKMYKMIGRRRYLWWGVGFAAISAAYAVDAFANYYLYARIVQTVTQPVPTAIDISWLHILGHLARVGLFLAGYVLLALVTLRFDDTRLVTLFGSLVGLLAVAIVASGLSFLFPAALILLISHVLFFTILNQRVNRREHKNPLQRAIIISFVFLLLGQFAYLLLPLWTELYVVGHILELLGYGILAGSMIFVLRRK